MSEFDLKQTKQHVQLTTHWCFVFVWNVGCWSDTGVCEKTFLFCDPLPCNPAAETAAPHLVLWKLAFQCIFFSGGVFLFADTGSKTHTRIVIIILIIVSLFIIIITINLYYQSSNSNSNDYIIIVIISQPARESVSLPPDLEADAGDAAGVAEGDI